MDLRLSPAEAAFRDEVRAFIKERLPDEIRERLRRGHPPRKQDTVTWHRILNERGWAAPHWPKEYGGADLGQMERLILLDENQRAPAPSPLVFNVNMLGPLLLEFGTDAQKREWLPRLANLDTWFCQGFSEPGAGSDLASLRTAAKRDGNHYVVNGQKIWTTTAHLADWVFALVRTSREERKQQGISFLLIDLKTPGITIRPIISIDGGHHLNEVFFEDVKVPVENLVGEEGRGWDCAKFLLANERTGIANVGLCRERLDYVRDMTRTTTEGGRPLIEDARIGAELARLDADVRALELTNLRFLLTPAAQEENPAFASMLKLRGAELQQAISELFARVAGPEGLEQRSTEGEDAMHRTAQAMPRYFYNRAATIYGGTNEVQKDILARVILR